MAYVHVKISDDPQQKLKHAVDTKSPMSIRLNYKDLCGTDVLALTNSQVNRMTKAYQDGKGITIKLSKRQVFHSMKIEGGFLGFLAGLAAKVLPCLAKTLANIGNWSTVRCWVDSGAKSDKQGYGTWVVFEKRFKHCKSQNRQSRAVFETFQRFGAWHG